MSATNCHSVDDTLYLRVADHEELQRIEGLLIRALRGKLVIVGRATDLYDKLIQKDFDVQMVNADSPIPNGAIILPPVDQFEEFAKNLRHMRHNTSSIET